MRIIVIRHASTAWNELGIIQGRANPPLSSRGLAAAANWRLPRKTQRSACFVSPLKRAIETAASMGFQQFTVAPSLIEMDWGAFEGRRLADCRRDLGVTMAANEARGLDFRPPFGESPRDVAKRLSVWLLSISVGLESLVLISHKGVRRALISMATGWEMKTSPPVRVANEDALILSVRERDSLCFVGTSSLVVSK